MRYRIVPLWFLILCSTFLSANDTLVTLGAGGLVPLKSTEIVMEAEDLHISAHEITVKYVLRNTSDRPVETIVAFVLPDLDGAAVYNEPMNLPRTHELNFVDFSVESDGKRLTPKMEARAFRGNEEVTALLKSADLPVNVELEPLNAAIAKLPRTVRQRLEREELIVPGDFNPPLHSSGKKGWRADWTMRIRYYWPQRFPANASVVLQQSYQPVVGGSYIVKSGDGTTNVAPYCGTSETVHRIAELMKRHPVKEDFAPVLLERRIDYVLTTANNWKGPIGRFQLTVETDAPEDILVTCTPGLKPVSPTQYELVQSDFRPADELKLLILQPWTPQ